MLAGNDEKMVADGSRKRPDEIHLVTGGRNRSQLGSQTSRHRRVEMFKIV
jgi:hypothetical protein